MKPWMAMNPVRLAKMLVSRETLEIAAPLVAGARLLGLDVEWKPFHSFSKSEARPGAVDCPASVLQVGGIFHWILCCDNLRTI